MKRLHWAILRALPLPFLAAFGTLLFLLLMQFLIKWLPQLVGRGLPFGAMAELIVYSLAYMVTLAVPMAWLISMLAAFGRLAESRAYLVIKSAGVPLWRLAWPTLIVGAGLVGGMGYFNNVMLPEANFRMNALWRDISLSRPAFALEPGVFFTGVDGYAIRAEDIPPDSSGLLLGVTVVESRTASGGQAVLAAKRATIQPQFGGQRLTLLLEDGEAHVRRGGADDRYERLAFARHRVAFDLGSVGFERREAREGSRSDRSMRTSEMLAVIDSLEAQAQGRSDSVFASALRLGRTLNRMDAPPLEPTTFSGDDDNAFEDAIPRADGSRPEPEAVAETERPERVSAPTVLAGLPEEEARSALALATERARTIRATAEAGEGSARYERQRADRFRVEVYKKNSIALACLVFVLVGVPLGLAIPRAGVGVVATLAVAVFLFYWVTLVQGEKLADRGLLPPWLGMWAANVVIGLIGAYLVTREARDPAWRDPFATLAGFVKRRKG
ncbi:MAG: LptF/LptG family permease [Bacteroidota bacterium]